MKMAVATSLGTIVLTAFRSVQSHRACGAVDEALLRSLGLVIGLPGCLLFAWSGWGAPGRPPLSAGYVSPLGLAAITPATWLAAPLGARLAHSLPRAWLRRAFALFLALTAAKMLGAFQT